MQLFANENVTGNLFLQLVALEKINAEEAAFFFSAILTGLNMHGQHEGAQSQLLSAAMNCYELLVSRCIIFIHYVGYSTGSRSVITSGRQGFDLQTGGRLSLQSLLQPLLVGW